MLTPSYPPLYKRGHFRLLLHVEPGQTWCLFHLRMQPNNLLMLYL